MRFQGRFVETSAGNVFVQRGGQGRPLVLLHGFMMSHLYWRDVLPRLAERHEIFAVDLPGFGESDRPPPLGLEGVRPRRGERGFAYGFATLADVVAEVMDRLGIARADVLGHSMGGGVAVELAGRHPDRVDALALVCPTVFRLPIPPEAKLMLVPHLGLILWKTAVTRGELRRQMLRQHFNDPAPVTEEFLDEVWSRFNRAGGREASYQMVRAFSALDDGNTAPSRVRARALLVWGDSDRMVPLEHGYRLERVLPGARLAVIPDCGHNVHLERPAPFLDQVAPFLDQVAPERGEAHARAAGAARGEA